MENQFLFNLKGLAFETAIISILVFFLTMLIKWPIKKVTKNFEENRRKALNTVIVFIPMILSLVLSVLCFGLMHKQWFEPIVFESMGTSYLLSVMAYAIYSRIVAVIKGSKTTSTESDFSKEAISFIKNNIKTLSSTLKLDEKKLNNVVTEVEKLLNLRNEITNSSLFQDISAAEKIDNQLSELQREKNQVESDIKKNQEQLKTYQKSLEKKGENKNGTIC